MLKRLICVPLSFCVFGCLVAHAAENVEQTATQQTQEQIRKGSYHQVGLGLSVSRIVIENGKTFGSALFDNGSENTYLIQAELLKEDMKTRAEAAVVSPSFALLNSFSSQRLTTTIIDPLSLPQDRESLFYLRVTAVEEKNPGQAGENSITLSAGTINKVFYRPKGLKGNLIGAVRNLQWRLEGKTLLVKNDSPYNVTITGIQVDKKQVQNLSVIATPYSETATDVEIGTGAHELEWYSIDEIGLGLKGNGNVVF